jgi:hypothetical protein
MKWLISLLAKLVPELIAKLFKKENPDMEYGHSDGNTEKRLKDKIDETWGDSDSD